MLVEAMSEGAATVSSDGAVLYSNRKFAEMIRKPPGKVGGMAVHSLLAGKEQDRFETFLAKAQKGVAKGEFNLRPGDGSVVPVHVSLNRFRGYQGHALGMVVTDLSEQKRKQAAEIRQTEPCTASCWSARSQPKRRNGSELPTNTMTKPAVADVAPGKTELSQEYRNMAAAKAQGHRLREITAQAIDEIGRLARGLHPGVSTTTGWVCPEPIRYGVFKDAQNSRGSRAGWIGRLRLAAWRSAHVVPHSPGGTDQRSEACGSQDSRHCVRVFGHGIEGGGER